MRIWRYMDFGKFKRFAESQELYFCGARHFEDRFEGEYAWGKTGHARFIEAQEKMRHSHGAGMPLEPFIAANLKTLKDMSQHAYINCWHHSDHESEAMWKLYCKNPEEGVLICTTPKKLADHLKPHNLPNLELRKVEYMHNFWIKKYNPEPSVFFSKRISFQHEKEFRAVFRENPNDFNAAPSGKTVTVDFSTLIEEVRISPLARRELKIEVQHLLGSAGIHVPVTDSDIEMYPILSVEEQVTAEGPDWKHMLLTLKTRDS